MPTEGVRGLPASQIRATFPVLHNPANRHRAVAFTPKQFHYAFTNTLSEEESAAVYERYHVPSPGRWVWDGVLANVKPGHQDTWVDYRNDDRAPCCSSPAARTTHARGDQQENRTATQVRRPYRQEFEGRDHYTIGAPGWEKVADYARTWATEHAPGASASLHAARDREFQCLSSRSRRGPSPSRLMPEDGLNELPGPWPL